MKQPSIPASPVMGVKNTGMKMQDGKVRVLIVKERGRYDPTMQLIPAKGVLMFSPYFDQEEPQVEIVGIIADLDISEPYLLNACAVFKAKKGYVVVFVEGCSCWPDRGFTFQFHCLRRVDVDKKLTNKWSELKDLCQQKKWIPEKETDA